MNIEGVEVDRNGVLKKMFRDSLERCEVIVSEEMPVEFKFYKK